MFMSCLLATGFSCIFSRKSRNSFYLAGGSLMVRIPSCTVSSISSYLVSFWFMEEMVAAMEPKRNIMKREPSKVVSAVKMY